ncbi:TetR/AcrR family transcriptional regulator [Nocardioides sp. B-3]|uniref:TetR/AcrR family transcriptional regulator n=1 Tax=Nocardioides sp. B-3 TaxID=2895565 RepID=UPI002153364A|nr:TetR family transcriptional regulator [Nocardioides sp. B-3]UUZ61057.1 TetR family transcriptional regulator [Nocardioides sp. B-3]
MTGQVGLEGEISLRQRMIAVAVEMTTNDGWAHVTMSRLARAVGVSRQTVYNEIGTKNALAEAMILTELDNFPALVTNAFDQHPDDLPDAIRAAILAVLELAQDNPLLHAVVSATHGADTELLPLLTTHSTQLLDLAKVVVGERVAAYKSHLTREELDGAIDMVVRVVLSHVMQPSGTPARTAATLAFVARRVLED